LEADRGMRGLGRDHVCVASRLSRALGTPRAMTIVHGVRSPLSTFAKRRRSTSRDCREQAAGPRSCLHREHKRSAPCPSRPGGAATGPEESYVRRSDNGTPFVALRRSGASRTPLDNQNNPYPQKGGYPAPTRLTLLTGANRDFPNWRDSSESVSVSN